MRDKEEWAGTATELLAAMRETETIPTVITKWLNEYRTTFLNENHIVYQYSRKNTAGRFRLQSGRVTAVTVVTAILGYPLLLSLTLKAV